MSEPLTIELSDDAYAALEQSARAAGMTPTQLAAEILAKHSDAVQPSERSAGTNSETQSARERFERHFGAVDLGYPTGADNRDLDADLAREYAARHDDD